jgi:transcriptional regulator with XRE-family HTH domain
MKLGRPKAKSQDHRSFGPLGDLIRKHRLERGLGLADVAKACQCSVQFISNIEHGRAPLPWDKAARLAAALKLPAEDLQVANLAIRADFKSFVFPHKGQKISKPQILNRMADAVSAVAWAAKDDSLQAVIMKYQTASQASRKRFLKEAVELLKH